MSSNTPSSEPGGPMTSAQPWERARTGRGWPAVHATKCQAPRRRLDRGVDGGAEPVAIGQPHGLVEPVDHPEVVLVVAGGGPHGVTGDAGQGSRVGTGAADITDEHRPGRRRAPEHVVEVAARLHRDARRPVAHGDVDARDRREPRRKERLLQGRRDVLVLLRQPHVVERVCDATGGHLGQRDVVVVVDPTRLGAHELHRPPDATLGDQRDGDHAGEAEAHRGSHASPLDRRSTRASAASIKASSTCSMNSVMPDRITFGTPVSPSGL